MVSKTPNRWLLNEAQEVTRYLSDQYNGRVMGFESRGGVTLAETPSMAVGIAGVGSAIFGFDCDLPEDFRFHIRRPDLKLAGYKNMVTAAHCAILAAATRSHSQLHLGVSLNACRAGLRVADYGAKSSILDDLIEQIAEARSNLEDWQKTLFLSIVMLSLSNEQTDISRVSADGYYAALIMKLQEKIEETAQDDIRPVFSVVQQSGTSENGTSGWMLAEATLDLNHPSFRVAVATPTYPYEIVPHSIRRLTGRSASIVAELSALAAVAMRRGEDWFCPVPILARAEKNSIVVRFRTMSGLVLEGDHGFDLVSEDKTARIETVTIRGKFAVLELNRDASVITAIRYAYGKTTPRAGFTANYGGIRDSFGQESLLAPGHTLRRWALSNEIAVENGRNAKEEE